MKGHVEMQKEKNLNNAVLLYFIALVIMVVVNMLEEVELLDIIYLIALICAIIKYFLIVYRK